MEWYTAWDEAGQSVLFVDRAPKGPLEFVFHSPSDAAVTPLEGISGDEDSDGPALLAIENDWAGAGLSSYPDKNGHSLGTYGVLEVYTRVSDHTDWIERGLNGQLDADDPKGCSAAGLLRMHGVWWFICLLMWPFWRRFRAIPNSAWS